MEIKNKLLATGFLSIAGLFALDYHGFFKTRYSINKYNDRTEIVKQVGLGRGESLIDFGSDGIVDKKILSLRSSRRCIDTIIYPTKEDQQIFDKVISKK